MVEVSVVLATYNRGIHLMRTLRSLLCQSLDRELWELVVVNNNSSDDTRELFAAFAAEHHGYNLRLVDETSQGLSYARNRGIVESVGQVIVMVDDDEEFNSDFLLSYHNLFVAHVDAVAAGGVSKPLYEYPTPNWVSHYAERPIAGNVDLGEQTKYFPRKHYPAGGNMAFRRVAFERYGLFNTSLGRTGTKLLAGEEKDIFNRVRSGGDQIYYVPGAVMYHIIPQSRMMGDYFDRVTTMTGVSERVRTLSISPWAYVVRLASEVVKWGGAAVLALGFLLRGTPIKGVWLLRMRLNTTRGLLGREV